MPPEEATCGLAGGVFYHNSHVRFEDILDGLSNTIFVGERNSVKDFSTWVGVVRGAKTPITRIVGTTLRVPNSRDAEFEDFSSRHLGLTLFLFGDGGVRALKDNMDAETFQSIGTRANLDVINQKELK